MQINHFTRKGVYFTVSSDWSHFWLFVLLGFSCLVISALLAKVKIGSFPRNPIYWHYWVVAKAETPVLNGESINPKFLRTYMFLLVGSICFFIQAFYIFVVMFIAS